MNSYGNRLLEFYHLMPLKHSESAHTLGISDKLIDIFNVIATLIDLPPDGRFFKQSEQVVRILISAWEVETNERFLGQNSINEIYRHCADIDANTTLHDVKTANPVYSYLMLPTISGMLGIEEKLKILSPAFLKRINQCCSQMQNVSNNYRYSLCLAARKLTIAAPTVPSEPTFDWDHDCKLAMAKAATRSVIQGESLTHIAEWTYISDLLFRDRTRPGRSSGGGLGKTSAVACSGLSVR